LHMSECVLLHMLECVLLHELECVLLQELRIRYFVRAHRWYACMFMLCMRV